MTTKKITKEKKIANISKLQNNPFAKKYKEELERSMAEESGFYNKRVGGLEEVKSFKRGAIADTINLTYLFLAFIIGFSVCAILLTNL